MNLKHLFSLLFIICVCVYVCVCVCVCVYVCVCVCVCVCVYVMDFNCWYTVLVAHLWKLNFAGKSKRISHKSMIYLQGTIGLKIVG